MSGLLAVLLGLSGPAWALPVRQPARRPEAVTWQPGRRPDVLVVKLSEHAGLVVEGGRIEGPGRLDELRLLLAGARPVFPRDPAAIRADRETFDPEHRLADLTLYLRLATPDAAALGTRLLADPRVESAWLAFEATRPPTDLPPTTPDFTELQGYRGPAPGGFDFEEALLWPGGTGANVTIADVEYAWRDDHEDLDATVGITTWGGASGLYAYHGTAVLGMLVGGDNGYGVTGLLPEAQVVVVYPYTDDGDYDVAAAIDGAASLLDAGDVLLIEQQAIAFGYYCPVEVSPAVFDAIALAVAKGVVVVEPAGNGGADLDDPAWDGWFDREQRDSGAILVGGGASPDSGSTPRAWSLPGSSHGSRVDLQGWYDSVVTTISDGTLTDLFYPDGDDRQAYTASFSGTSAASPMVAGAAAVANSVAWDLWGQPWDPGDLRAALVSTGTPQAGEEHIGPQPDLRRFLRTWGVR